MTEVTTFDAYVGQSVSQNFTLRPPWRTNVWSSGQSIFYCANCAMAQPRINTGLHNSKWQDLTEFFQSIWGGKMAFSMCDFAVLLSNCVQIVWMSITIKSSMERWILWLFSWPLHDLTSWYFHWYESISWVKITTKTGYPNEPKCLFLTTMHIPPEVPRCKGHVGVVNMANCIICLILKGKPRP